MGRCPGACVAPLALAVALLLACGSARRGEPWVEADAVPNEEIALGQRVFDLECGQCHPGGAGGLGFALNNRPLPGWLIKFQVRRGVGAMPPFSEEQIGDRELDAVAEYLEWLRGQNR